jgi:dynein heavy chain 1
LFLGQVDHYEKRLRANLEELQEIRNVWKSLENVCNRLEELKDTQWISIQPKKLKANLEELLSSMTAMVSEVKNYHSYNAVKTNIENYLKVILFKIKFFFSFI